MKSALPGSASRLRIIVLGYIVRCPLGGMAWHYLHYVLGLAQLGHDVYFVEDSDDYPSCYDPSRHIVDRDPTYGLAFTAQLFEAVGIGERWAYYDAHTDSWLGPAAEYIHNICATADLLLNISGSNPLRSWLQPIPARAYIDTDPVFEQIRQLTNPKRSQLARKHTSFLTFGGNMGREGSHIPDDGLPWQVTRQPIVLEQWPVTAAPDSGKYTTIMQWKSYPAREYEGVRYGQKADSFDPYLDLPRKVKARFELALGTPSAPRDRLRHHGWLLCDPLAVTRTPERYRRYIQHSRAEFSVAKEGYVVGRCGWFSERSAAYLASGRPVVVQDTGFTDWLRPDGGLLPFTTPEEALDAVNEVERRYLFHCRAAREVAEATFDSRQVLPDLVEMATNPHQAKTQPVAE